jgi:hypothetical protein
MSTLAPGNGTPASDVTRPLMVADACAPTVLAAPSATSTPANQTVE